MTSLFFCYVRSEETPDFSLFVTCENLWISPTTCASCHRIWGLFTLATSTKLF